MAESVGGIYYEVDARTGGLIDAQRQVDRSTRTMERSFDRVEGSLSRVSAGVKTAIASMATITVAGTAFKKVIQDTANFEQAMLQLQAVSGSTEDQMAKLEKQARELGATTQFSAQQAAEGQRFLAQAGFDANQILAATPGILQLATAGSLDLARAADIASNVLGQFQLPVSELSRVNDVLADSARSANTNIDQMAEALSMAGPIANSAGISLEETAAAIGTLSNAGIQGSRAGTGVLGVIRQLSNVTPQAEKVLAKYGLTVSDVNIETNGLSTVLDRLRGANMNTADSFAVFQSEAGPAAQILAANAAEVTKLSQRYVEATGTADEMAQKIGQGLAGAIRTFNSALGETILKTGESGVGGSFEYLIDTASGVLSAYNGMLDLFVKANDISEEQEAVIKGVADGLKVFAALLAGRVVGSLGTATAAMAAKTAASIRDLAATKAADAAEAGRQAMLARTAAAEKTAEANNASLAAQRATSARLDAAAEASRLAAVKASLTAERALETQRLQSQISATGRAQSLARLAELRTAETATMNQQTAASARLTAAQQAEASAARLAATATAQQSAASKAATAAMAQQAAAARATGTAATAMAVATRAATGALALVGGPVGVAVLAAGALVMYHEELDNMLAPTKRAKQAVSDLTDEIDRNSRAALENGIAKFKADMADLESQAKEARAEIERINDANNPPGPFRNSMVMGEGAAERKEQFETLDKLGVQIQARKEGIASLQQSLDNLGNASGDGAGGGGDNSGNDVSSGSGTSASDQTKQETEKLQQEMDRRRQAVISALQSESEAAFAEYQQRNVEIQSLFEDGSDQQRELLERNNEDYLSRIQNLNQRERDEQQRHQEQLAKMRQEDYARRLQEITGFSEQAVQKLLEIQTNAADPMAALTRNLGDAFVNLDDTIASTFVNAMSRGEGLNDILGEIGRTVLASLLQSFIKLGVQMAINAAMGNAYQTAAAATAAATGATIAAAYAPAAAMVSLATMGANAVPAAAALSSTTAIASGLSVAGGRQYGGNVNAGSAYRVTEDGKPELYSDGTRSYLLPGRNGKVTANKDMAASGGGTPAVTVQLYGTGAENARVSQSEGPNREQIIQIMLEDAYENGPVRRAYGV
ncbi:phage tail tape measure protein [Salinicola salarius]|uniref:phage tail tape measure protein n=1 Tax=Salinicola salarius TaxID=430457 RepID=UPI0023E459FE|nr:phage tail tape measure protein [Salinicola salarius]MDF3917525.1 phage tail tape measure protein [Salinicola salarius]